jgi:dihydropteroate synthase
MRPQFTWNIGKRSLELGHRTLVMGVVNVTPDSFSDGGLHFDRARAVEHALRLLDEGADIIDVGGESTRPGAAVKGVEEGEIANRATVKTPVSAEEELRRVVPVIEEVKKRHPAAVLSVDTYKAEVARAAVEAGAEIVNDISGLQWDRQMPTALAGLRCGVVLMHVRGRPNEWRNLPPVADVVALVRDELRQRSDDALAAGIAKDRIVLDPGLGFGKNFEQNYPLLAQLDELLKLGFPLLVGASRKSFIGRALRRNGKDLPADQRLYGTIAAETMAILQGAHIIRTHDVRAAVDAARMSDAVLNADSI